MINKGRILRLTFGGFIFAALYSIGISIATGFEFMAFLQNTLILTLIFFVVINITDFLIRFLLNRKRK